MAEKTDKKEYEEIFRATHSFKDGEEIRKTSLTLSERKEDGKVFLTLWRDEDRITISLSDAEIAELYARLMAYIVKRW